MNPVSANTEPSAVLRNGFFQGLEQPLQQVEETLKNELRSDTNFVDELLTYVGSMGGKRMRPAIMLLSAQAVGRVNQDHITLAAVVEMIHMATLVHDDILDDAETRRHRQTVNKKWDNQSSVLLGDYLFTHSFYLASTLDTTYGCRIIGQSTNKVCAGELQQVGNRGNLRLTEEEYFEIINGKTAELCACATHLGAYYAGADATLVEKFERFGRELGLAFQIADDLLDLTGDEKKTGKSLGSDLENQKLTLPLIHLVRSAEPEDQRLVLRILDEPITAESRRVLQNQLDKYGSLEYAKQTAISLAHSAVAQLVDVADSKAKDTLVAMAEFVVARTH